MILPDSTRTMLALRGEPWEGVVARSGLHLRGSEVKAHDNQFAQDDARIRP
jgi:hypothetical protein